LELLLNLCWLLLGVPAVWVWQRARCARPECRVHSRRSLLLIACVVLLLFPIISASDDLQAMRPEVEESTSRDAQRHAQGGRHSAQVDCAGILSALPESAAIPPNMQCIGQVAALVVHARGADTLTVPSGRAPPSYFLA
jgi:hypothetical protein